MERWNGRVALVTGASVGIGAAICRLLVKHGITVFGCAREVQKIQDISEENEIKMSPGRLHAIKCDLTQESEITAMFDEIRLKCSRIDICINNAGFSTNSPLLSGRTTDWRNMLEVNVLALCICTRESVKLMLEKNIDDGQIINISSIGGHRLVPLPEMYGGNFYCGTKFMIRALTEGLRREMKGTNTHIRVASISPGMVQTEFFSRMFENKRNKPKAMGSSGLQSDDIADAVLYILKSPPHVDVHDIIVRPIDQIF